MNAVHMLNDRMTKSFGLVKFLSKVIVVFLLFFGMVMYSNEVQTKEK